jgi:hypothetical protein
MVEDADQCGCVETGFSREIVHITEDKADP